MVAMPDSERRLTLPVPILGLTRVWGVGRFCWQSEFYCLTRVGDKSGCSELTDGYPA